MGLDRNRLLQLRTSKGVTQQQVADSIGISMQRYHNYEVLTHQPDIDTLSDLAAYFDVNIEYLLGKTDLLINHKDIELLALIKNLPNDVQILIANLTPDDLHYLRLIHGLPDEHKECLLRMKPADVEILDYLYHLSDHPTPYFIEGHLIGIPKNLSIEEVDQIKAFLDFIAERHNKAEQEETQDKE